MVDYPSQADIKVYIVDYSSQARGDDENWYFVDYSSQADSKIYWVKYSSQADLKVYIVDYRSQAGWNKSHKLIGRIR